ncbi:nucleoside triphosphate pyrophosphohydrolase [Halovivax gelatinilyticus]|uniref:nucleoside triphosphate pyrophosphohydrolase n=1 Tax=Halovivax gelatinilyticus TaxID=2961597 RepID=UPI0020CA8688|nr:nucleoside triphosphate pyrophosphohydrolase [Halovivax gelatinilyticus]
METEYDKLVRDEIPEIIERSGDTPVWHRADDAEYERRLHEKLREEVDEYADDPSTEELADVLEVIHAIRAHTGVTDEQLERRRAQKAEDRGRFDERIVLERVES